MLEYIAVAVAVAGVVTGCLGISTGRKAATAVKVLAATPPPPPPPAPAPSEELVQIGNRVIRVRR